MIARNDAVSTSRIRCSLLKLSIVWPTFWIAAAHQAPAQETVLQLDPAQTAVSFSLHATLHTVHGTFKLKSGNIRFDPSTGKANGLIVVDATSAQTGNGGRDRKMHQEILESQQYPEITFAPVRVRGQVAAQGDSQVDLQGVVKLHGSEHEASINAKIHAVGDRLAVNANLLVPYIEWGLKNPSTFVLRVSDKVELEVRGAGRLTRPPDHP